jgi:hypothetical protein
MAAALAEVKLAVETLDTSILNARGQYVTDDQRKQFAGEARANVELMIEKVSAAQGLIETL